MPSPQPRRATILLLALSTLWCLYWFVHAWHYFEDDAYIHIEFARSVAAGHGFAFDGHLAAGDSAPLWVLLLVAMHALIPNWIVAGKVLSILAVILGLTGAYAFARRLAAALTPSAAAWLPAALVLLIVANPYFCYWAFSGMEPIAAAGLAFWAVLAATRATPTTRTLLAACLLAGLAPLLRPEMIFLAALLVLPLFALWRRLPDAASSALKLAIFAAGLFLLCVPLALWSLYSLHAFGHIIPNTNAAKRAGPTDSVISHLLDIYSVGLPLVLWGLLGGVAYLLLRPRAVRDSIQCAIDSAFTLPNLGTDLRSLRSLPLAGWIFILWPLFATLFYIANHTYVQTRYILATAPGLTIVIVLLAWSASRRLGRPLYLSALSLALLVSVTIVRPFVHNKAFNCLAIDRLSLLIRDRLPPTAPVAVYSIGQVAFISQHPIVDIAGITQPAAIPYLGANSEQMFLWAQSQGAQYFLGDKPEPDAVRVYASPQRFIGWTSRPALYSTSSAIELWKLAPPTTPLTAEASLPPGSP
jgi:hypothetical protein